MKLSKKNYDEISTEDRVILTRWQEIWEAHTVNDYNGLFAATQKLARDMCRSSKENFQDRIKTIEKLIYNSKHEASEILERLNEGLKR